MTDAEHARNLAQHSELAYNRGDAALGRKYVAGALNMSHDVPEAWYKLGVEHMQAQRLPQAVAAFRRVLEVIPDSAYALTNLGWTRGNKAGITKPVKPWRPRPGPIRACRCRGPTSPGRGLSCRCRSWPLRPPSAPSISRPKTATAC